MVLLGVDRYALRFHDPSHHILTTDRRTRHFLFNFSPVRHKGIHTHDHLWSMAANDASCIKIWSKPKQNCDRESAATRKCKMAAMTSSNSKFQKPRKMTLANILKIICVKFHQNRFICLGCRDDTDRQTDRHTHTHTLGSIATYSVKMTEYKNAYEQRSLALIIRQNLDENWIRWI